MIETIALGLVKTLATFLFKSYVLMQSNINIDGAPHWYMQNVSSHVCVYDYKTGGMEAVEKAKAAAYPRMERELSGILEAVIYENYSNLRDPKEKAFVMMFRNDPEAPVFIRKNMSFPNIDYSKKDRIAFVKACIDKDTVIDYQEKRVETIKYELTHKRADDAFEEMESGDMSLE